MLQAIKGRNIYFPVMVAQVCLESGYGGSDAAKKYNNFGGIRNLSGRVPLAIGASDDRNKYAIYATAKDYFKSHVAVVSQSRYVASGVFAAITPEGQLLAIAKGGYCDQPKDPNAYYGLIAPLMKKVKEMYPTTGKIL